MARNEMNSRKRKPLPSSSQSVQKATSRGQSYKYRKPALKWRKHGLLSQIQNTPIWLFIFSIYFLTVNVYQTKWLSKTSSSSSFLPQLPEHISDPHLGDFSHKLDDFSVEIFSAPKPFIDQDAIANKRAIRSWLRLNPQPQVTLLGYETGYDEAAAELGLRLERRVDKNFLGVPLFNSMFEHANNSKATITVIINGDILLFDDFMTTLKRIVSTFDHFLIISARYDVDNLPTDLDESDPEYTKLVRNHVWDTGTLHTYGGMDVWAWNTAGPRLFDPKMPHFVFGRGKYDNWLTHETIAAGRRQVIDVSETCLTVHLKHDYHFVDGEANATRDRISAFWSKGKNSKFELFINIYLSLHVGSYSNQKGNVMYAPWKLANCMQDDGMCLMKRQRPGSCNCEFSPFTRATQTDPTVKPGTNFIRCGSISEETKADFKIPVRLPKMVRAINYEFDEDDNLVKNPTNFEPPPFGLPLTFTSVLEKVAINNTIILTALNFGYRSIMMNWVCNMRQLGITNFVIASLDEMLYKYAFIRSLPTYYESTIFNGMNQSLLSHAAYGSDEFKMLTKLKSRVVVRILRKGYNVLWTDCDIVYFKNPLIDLWSYNADIAIQSNAPDGEPLNGYRRINSGFYLAKSNEKTIKTFEDVIKFAARSRMSEQPCFYDVICGKKGQTVMGNDMCQYKNVSLRLLDRSRYPNGVTGGIWNTTDGEIPYRWPHLYILHNNWIKGALKEPRFKRHGFVFFDKQTEICTYSLPLESDTTAVA